MGRTVLFIPSSGDIDMYDDVSTPLNFNIADIRTPEKRNSNYSKTIKIPGTANNNLLFGNIFDVNVSSGSFNPNAKVKASLLIDGEEQINGYLQMLNIIIDDEHKIEYEVMINGNVGNIFNALGALELTDLDFSAYDHTYDYATQIASWSNTYMNGYCYPLIDYGFDNVVDNFNVTHLFPSIFLRTYIDKMFSDQGYTYTSSFFDSTFFKKLIVPANAVKLILTDTQIAPRLFETTQTVQTSGSIDNGLPIIAIYDTEISDVSGQYDNVGGLFTVAQSGYYNLACNGSLNVLAYLGTGVGNMKARLRIEKYNGFGYVAISEQIQYINVTGASSYTLYTGITNVFLTAGDTLKVTVKVEPSVPGAFTGAYTFNGGTFKNTVVNSGIIEGDTCVMNQAVPSKIKQKDLFLSVVKMFNLYIDVDKDNDKNLIINTRDDFYSSGTNLDWSGKLDNSKPIEFKPMGDLDYKEFYYNYTDDGDYFNKKYKDTYQETYGRYRFTTENEFLSGINETKVIFSPTPLVGDNASDRVIPRIWNVSESNVVSSKAFNIRLLYLGGTKTSNVAYSYVSTGGTHSLTQYLYAGHLDDTQNPTLDLSFGVPQEIYYYTSLYTNNNIFNSYHKKQIEEITDRDSKIVTAYFYLRPSDIRTLDFRNQFWFENQYFRLNKIYDYDPLKHDVTKCEFIKIKDAGTFTATLHSMTGGLSQAFGTAIDTFPIFSNWTADTVNNVIVSGAARAMVGGSDNILNDNLRAPIIQGNSNTVGNSTGVALIGSSSGNIIDSGLEGVVMINTHDTNVSSGDVTFINHVPFPQMIPLYAPIKNISANYDISVLDGTLLVTTGASNVTINLRYQLIQYAQQWFGFDYLGSPKSLYYTKMINIKKIDSGVGSVIIDPYGAATIDGAATLTLPTQYDSVTLQYDGTNWFIL